MAAGAGDDMSSSYSGVSPSNSEASPAEENGAGRGEREEEWGEEGSEGGWDDGRTLASLEFDGEEEEEEGTPVPAGLRPPGQEEDVLCDWSLRHLRKDKDLGVFASGAFGACGVRW